MQVQSSNLAFEDNILRPCRTMVNVLCWFVDWLFVSERRTDEMTPTSHR